MNSQQIIFGTTDNLDEFIINKFNTESGTEYLLECYDRIKNEKSNEIWQNYSNYCNLFLKMIFG